MKNKLKSLFPRFFFCANEKGVVGVEVATVFIIIIMLFYFIAEICYVVFLSSSLDLAISEAALYSSATSKTGDYATIFKEKMVETIEDTPLLFNADKLSVSVEFCTSVQDIIDDVCSESDSSGHPIALYHIQYYYTPVFYFLETTLFSDGLERTIVMIQEKERTTSSS